VATTGRRSVNQSNQAARWRRKELEIWARCDAEGRQPTDQEVLQLWRAHAITARRNQRRRERRARAAARASVVAQSP
jgi:hypothetical protein